MALPLIRNEKSVDPTQPETPRVYQLETAMGQAMSLFAQAQAVHVARRRFLPVKVTNDLLALWSDAYVLNEDYSISLIPLHFRNQPELMSGASLIGRKHRRKGGSGSNAVESARFNQRRPS